MAASEPIKNLGEKVKGQIKETAGEVLDKEDLRREGEAQQNKAEAQDDADRLEEMAKEKQQEAFGYEGQQKSQQQT
jgi:uncharacterized protein YjbJ (UPF0337 family)